MANNHESFVQFADKIADAHALYIGKVVIAWNWAHESLAHIFANIVSPESRDIGLAAWHAVLNDRSQRAMLEAAAKIRPGESTKFFKDLQWCLNHLTPLEIDRNNVLHSPYSLTFDGTTGIKFSPLWFTGNRRALGLKDKDLEIELKSLEERISLLTNFALHLGVHMNGPEDVPTWPGRPRLPRPAHASNS